MKDYPTYTIYKKVGCGAIYLLFLEEDGVFHRLFIRGDMGKESACGDSWLHSISKILTYSIRRGLWEGTIERGIIKQLKDVRCNTVTPNKDHIVSCADAIAKGTMQYLKMRGFLNEKH